MRSLPEITPDCIVTATLGIYHFRGGGFTGSTPAYAHPLTAGYVETEATWNEKAAGQPWTTPGGDYDETVWASADIPEAWENWVEWNVTGLLILSWDDVKELRLPYQGPC